MLEDEFGFKIVEKLPERVESEEDEQDFLKIDVTDIEDDQPAMDYEEWCTFIREFSRDVKVIRDKATFKKVLKTIIKTGVPADL
jgi:hypothetical protein